MLDAPSAVACGDTLAFPDKVDIVFSLDLTGSMSQEIAQIKAQVSNVMTGLNAAAPGSDIRFAVVTYEDYPGFHDSTTCPDSDYASNYGIGTDAPFRINLSATDVIANVTATVNGLTLGSGGDGPQSYGRVYWEIAQPDTATSLGLRPDSLKLIVDFGDDVPHDPDLNAGIFNPPFESWDTGYDPGRNGSVDCGGDDLDFQATVLPAVAAGGIHLVHIDSSGDIDLMPYWSKWVSDTGGEFAAIDSDGTIPGGLDLTQLIIELLQLVT